MSPNVRSIIAAVADAAERWRDADFPARVRATAAIRARTGYTEPVVDFALDALFDTIERRTLEAAIAGEIGSLAALDEFVVRSGRPDVRFVARDPVAIVASDVTIGVAIPALAFALCAKAVVRVKDRDDALTAAFARSIVEERPELRDNLSISAWDSAEVARSREFFDGAGAVVAYGSDAALVQIRNALGAGVAFTGFGHRTSVAYVTRETLDAASPERARSAVDLARDVLLYDGEGCLSPHAVFVEEGGAVSPAQFAAEFATALDEAAIEFPAGYDEPDAAVVAYRNAALFRAAQGRGGAYAGRRGPHFLAFDPPDEPPPLLRRTVAVYPVARPADAMRFVIAHTLPLEGVAISASRPDVQAFAVASGAARIAPIGELQRPPLGGEHGGSGRILPFLRAIYRA